MFAENYADGNEVCPTNIKIFSTIVPEESI